MGRGLLMEYCCGGVDINEPDVHNSVPLFYACLCGHRDVVEYLLQAGAKLNRGQFETERCFYAAHDYGIKRLLEAYQATKRSSYWKLSNVMLELFESGLHSDFTFIVSGKKIASHKWVLCSRSHILNKFFGGQWKGKKEIFVRNYSADSFYYFLEYLYTGSANFDSSFVDEVLEIAQKFSLAGLCQKLMIQKIAGKEKIVIEEVPEEKVPDHLYHVPYRLEGEDYEVVDQSLYNLVFKVDDHHFFCHREMFSLQTDYFDVMFHSSFRESLTNSDTEKIPLIQLSEVNPDTFQGITEYLYTHSSSLQEYNEILDLIELSHRYLIPDLTSLLTTRIHKLLTIENCFHVLSVGDHYDLRRLIDSCVDVIEENFHDLYDTEILNDCLENCSEYTSMHLNQLIEEFEDLIKSHQ
eukprot:TRINITY_DN4935_c0_g1_i2.p1 TRINITY_DN4935_c0_g1~~TRINITY_DN4935_c0_g1_i2.p1  ORF type:complete len:409 (+),score=75.97 TRINITY_DN4935_c0_g1_i2:365-1591(+)